MRKSTIFTLIGAIFGFGSAICTTIAQVKKTEEVTIESIENGKIRIEVRDEEESE